MGLGLVALALALAYFAWGARGASVRVRAALILSGATALVVLPTLGFVGLGQKTGRPYGQDGGVVQLPLALDLIAAGKSPYGADYSDSILGKESRVSDFWTAHGGNPILHHHAYLPGTHLLMLPFYLLRPGAFDPRYVTLAAYAIATLLAASLFAEGERKLVAAAVIALNPFLYWLQVFGANDVLGVAFLLGALRAGRRRPYLAAVLVGLACATKQLTWPFAPFLLVHLASVRDLSTLGPWKRLAGLGGLAGATFAVVVLPVAALDFGAFYRDIVAYNVGLPGADNYPLGGTPGIGFANFLIYFGRVHALSDYVPFSRFYLLLVPLGVLLLSRVLREDREAVALGAGVAALLASLYLSRVVHPNYLILAATLLPLAGLLGRGLAPDVVVAPLALLGSAVEVAQHAVLRPTWEDAVGARLPQHWTGLSALLGPRAGPGLTEDPLGLAVSALAAGCAAAYLVAGILRFGLRTRLALLALSGLAVVLLPGWVVLRVGEVTGQPRAQGPLVAAADALAPFAPEPPKEAWSSSFRHDPPGRLEGPPEPPAGGLGLLVSLVRRDPRTLTLPAALLAAALLVRACAPEERPLALAVLLSAPLALGVVFGSGDMALLAAVLIAASARWGGPLLSSLSAVFPRGAFLVLPLSRRPASLLLDALLPYTGVLLVGLALHPIGWSREGLEGGVGLPILFPGPGGALGLVLPGFVCLLAVAAGYVRPSWAPRGLALAGGTLLLGLFGAPGASALDLGLPIALLAFAAAGLGVREGDPRAGTQGARSAR
jgi:hypothetical protein